MRLDKCNVSDQNDSKQDLVHRSASGNNDTGLRFRDGVVVSNKGVKFITEEVRNVRNEAKYFRQTSQIFSWLASPVRAVEAGVGWRIKRES